MTDSVKLKPVNLEDLNAHSKVLFNKGVGNRGTCTTASATAAKEVTFGTTFSFTDGATALVRFTYGISAENATLAVTYTDSSGSSITTDAKAIYYRGAALPAGLVQPKDTLLIKYNGTQWDVIGTLNTDTTYDAGTAALLETGTDQTERTWQAKIIADYVKGRELNWLDLISLSYDYTFKKNDALFVGGALYKCTATTTTKPPFDFVFDANNSIVVDQINGQDAVVCDSLTLNTGWEKVLDLTDRYYTEERIKTRFDYANDGNVAVLGNGYGVCDTNATTAAKVVTIGNFILKTNGIVSVRFTSPIDAADATLNVSGTGAKTIKINGSNIQPGAVRAGNTVIFQYDGTYWNVVSVQGLEQGQAKSEFWVDLGLPSGLKWAKQNIAPSGFCSTPFAYICAFFSWGNIEGHTPTNDTFSYDFGSSNSGPYASTPGAKLTGSISPSMDAARAICGAPWRMPTSTEFQELFDNCVFVQADGTTEISASTTNKLVTVDGIVGIYLKSKKNGNNIFFPCSGYGDGTSWNYRGSDGLYWSGSLYSATHGRGLSFGSGGVNPQGSSNRFYGFAIRPVF